jgi:hypothetical protein
MYPCIEMEKIPVETIPRMGKGEIKEKDAGVNSTMIYQKNFVNVTTYS